MDGHGIMWATLADGNGVARLDPAQVRDGTSDGITIIRLDDCPVQPACVPEIPPVPNVGPTRIPTRVKSMLDGDGNTILWFVEAGASNIGVLHLSPDGRKLDEAHFPCGCISIESLDLAPDGSIWFTQLIENQIGRLVPDQSRLFSPAAARREHYDIPRKVLVPQPPRFPNLMTSLPLSVAVDGRGRVWFSESSLSSAAYLEPDKAQPNTSKGFTEFELPHSAFRSAAAPNDVTVDRANSFWWAGEYGDQIEQLTPDGEVGLRFRGSVRRGITEGPVTDKDGNLWVVETGGNLLTRITGVTEGPLVPQGLPTAYEADTTNDTLTGARLRDTTSVEIAVVRGADVVARADAPVRDGGFSIAAADWSGAADAIRPDDTIRIHPVGRYARATLSFRVARLSAAAGGSGPRSASSSVATVAATFRTITHFGFETGGDGSATTTAPTRPGGAGSRPAACAIKHWVSGTARGPKLPLLGMTRARLRACLGAPTSTKGARWRYGRGLVVTLRSGRVARFMLRDRRLRSARGGVGVGSPARRLATVLRGVRRDPRTGDRRAVVSLGRGRYADIKIRVDRRGRISRIDVAAAKRSQLDAFGRRLLRRHA
jgi:sugar lactone lactonase YvrE